MSDLLTQYVGHNMCKFIAIVNKKPDNKATINKLIGANLNDLSVEKSGYSVFRHNEAGAATNFYPKDTDYDEDNMARNLEYKGEEVYIVHFRTATCGDHGLTGLHLQPQYSGYFCCHNGSVRTFSDVQDRNDSLYFFDALLYEAGHTKSKQITPEMVEKLGSGMGFYGKAIMYQPKTKTMHFFMNVKGQLNCLEDCLIFSSYELKTNIATYNVNEVLGFKWFEKTGDEKIDFLYSKDMDDCYFRLENNRVVVKQKVKISYVTQWQSRDDSTGFQIQNYMKNGKKKWEVKRQLPIID